MLTFVFSITISQTTRPTRKAPYTGFVFTQRPRWFQPRSHPRLDPHPVVPPRQHTTHHVLHSTKPPPHLVPPTPPRPESTTQWWPPGVSHGPRPVSRIPIGVIYPEIGRWETDLTNVRVRTSATRFTYPPEAVNYPVTFDWNFPRHLRKDKWTQRPDWPLESPLWSSEAYDYLEERTLPRILESGETEFPPTSPLPWWTYPPWWLDKKGIESVNGTTFRPYTRKTTAKIDSIVKESLKNENQARAVDTLPKEAKTFEVKLEKAYGVQEVPAPLETRDAKADLLGIKYKSDKDGPSYLGKKKSSGEILEITQAPSRIGGMSQLHRKLHHRGPWWHLTVVEHFTEKTPEDRDNNRVKRSPKLIRQNAIRRKWKNIRESKNLSHTLDLKKTESVFVSDGNNSPSIQRVLSNFTFSWPKVTKITQSKDYIESMLTEALDEFNKHLIGEIKPGNIENTSQNQTRVEVEKQLADLHNLFLISLSNYSHQESSSLFLHMVTNEIGREVVKHLLDDTNIVRQHLVRLLEMSGTRNINYISKRRLEKSKLFNLYNLLCIHNFIGRDSSKKINSILKKLCGGNIDSFNHNSIHKDNLSNKEEKVQQHNNINRIDNVEKTIFRRKREDIIDITECPFNLSAQSIEKVVDEIVDEIVDEVPVDEINEEVKVDVLTAMHENQLKRLGKTNINKDVLKEMMKIESIDEAKFRNATESSVKKFIMKMVNEVLNILRQSSWKDLIIKLFDEGYSVDSVLETIANQISIEQLVNSLEKDGINITRYQKKLVFDEFKGYKSLLRKMLTQEVQLWEYQLINNQSVIRHRRDVLDEPKEDGNARLGKEYNEIFNRTLPFLANKPYNPGETNSAEVKNMSPGIRFRVKRDINDNEISKLSGENLKDHPGDYIIDEDLDKELDELKKSSMPKHEKIKVLKKRLKDLLDQTENPNDIVFPDNFEEELMRTENIYDEEVTPSPQRFKQRIRWNVRTKRPTTKVITYPMKIRMNRGRPFVPLTTTEEQTLIMVVSKPPSRKYRTLRPLAATKKIVSPTKSLNFPSKKPTKLKDAFWLYLTTPSTDFEKPKSTNRFFRMTLKPVTTFATERTFQTMKFMQKTEKPVISLQEFLKRRKDFRKERHGDMFNRPSSEEDKKLSSSGNLSDLSEEEQLSIEAKLSAEVNPSMFTFPPALTSSEPSKVVDNPSLKNTVASTEPLIPKSQKVNRKKTSRRKTALHSNRTRSIKPLKTFTTEEANTKSTIEVFDSTKNESGSKNTLRIKRDLSFLHPVTNTIKTADFSDVTVPPLIISNENFRGSTKNMSRKSLEDRIHLHNWSYGVKQPAERRKEKRKLEKSREKENKTDSFETYQQEHRKWFGVRRRGIPVNNFDIDWEQMRRKMEMHQVGVWQQQSPSMRPTVIGKLLRKNERMATPLTQATTPIFLDSSEKPSNLLDNMYKSALKKGRTKSLAKYYTSDENLSEKVNLVYPPYGKMEKDGHTAFGRLYHGKKHYQLKDSREKSFDEKDLLRLVNKTYDPDFRISTHRKSNWNNRTFDPNYVFTQFVPIIGKKTRPKFSQQEAIDLSENNITLNSYNLQNLTLETEHFNVLREQTNKTIIENTTEPQNETYVVTRSKRVPWNNNTDLETYKVYIRSRRRFYNKTVDIAFSYFIFHKFRCGNKTRDLGYGRMSNVVNRWYNKTFVPKFRPDMFYVRNRYKRGKEFNYFKNEMNIVHANISNGEFDLIKWMQIATEMNLEESNRTRRTEDEEFREKNKSKRIIEVFSSGFPFKSTPAPETNLSVARRWKQLFSTVATKVPTTKASFFQSVKQKGFGFFKSLFGKQDSEEKD